MHPVFSFFLKKFYVFFCRLRLHPRQMEVPRLGVNSELQLPAYTTATATWDPSHICDLYHSSWQCWILNPLSEARDWTHFLMVTSQILSAKPRWELLVFSFSIEHPQHPFPVSHLHSREKVNERSPRRPPETTTEPKDARLDDSEMMYGGRII